ncbi:MAG: hypothetical protein IPN20_21900 [Haliscomenobacter sp.]|nr:hypothetical protein [Haliscomenobacter sp.]
MRNPLWGTKVLDILSERLQQELPGLRGFSGENLKRMRRFYTEWSDSEYLRLYETTDNVNSMEPIRLSVTTELQDAAKPPKPCHPNSNTPCPMPKPLKN